MTELAEMEERRPRNLEDITPEECWRRDQADGWLWALHVRSDQYSYGLPACLEDAHRRALDEFRRSAWTWRRPVLEACGLIEGLALATGEAGPADPLTSGDSSPPRPAGTRAVLALAQGP